jgi:hypothetical protein
MGVGLDKNTVIAGLEAPRTDAVTVALVRNDQLFVLPAKHTISPTWRSRDLIERACHGKRHRKGYHARGGVEAHE